MAVSGSTRMETAYAVYMLQRYARVHMRLRDCCVLMVCLRSMPQLINREVQSRIFHAPNLATQRDWLVLRNTYALRQPLRLDYHVSKSHYSTSSWSLSCGLFIRALLTLVISSPVLSEQQYCVKARRHVLATEADGLDIHLVVLCFAL